eukprot:7406374-Pyramimonas_sp.AAC.1
MIGGLGRLEGKTRPQPNDCNWFQHRVYALVGPLIGGLGWLQDILLKDPYRLSRMRVSEPTTLNSALLINPQQAPIAEGEREYT